jgi:aminopeptidase N
LTQSFVLITYLSKVQNPEHFKTALNAVTDYSRRLRNIAPQYTAAINKELQKLKKKKEAARETVADKTAIAEELKVLDEKLKKQ